MSRIARGYTFEELVNLEINNSPPLIENFIYEGDHVLLVGKEKSNKSTLALQICCALTSGEPLFGQFQVPAPCDVVYLQAEGKIGGTRNNLINMTKALACDKSRAKLLYYPAIQMNREEGLKRVIDEIDSWRQPKLIIIDPLYQSMVGKIEEQEASSMMTAAMRTISERYKSAILLLHHAHRARRNDKGEIMEEGDDSVFGSFVWKAFPDTVFLIQKAQGHKNSRKLSCDTQRMGNVMPEIELTLVEPEPFFLQLKDDGKPIDEVVYFKLEGTMTLERIMYAVGKSRRHVSEALERLKTKGRATIMNPGCKPQIWARQ